MKSSVLDSYALLAFLFREKGSEKVAALLEKAVETDQTILISTVNWAEVRTMIERKAGPGKWSEARQKISGLPIEIVPVDQTLAELAGEIKVSKKMSLGDCFVAALAKQKNSEIYTGDPDFKVLEPEWKMVWL